MGEIPTSPPNLSSRGQRQLDNSGPATLFAKETRSDLYDSEENPQGLINFGLAENGLMTGELSTFLEQNFKLTAKDYVYTDHISGTTRLLSAVCSFVNETFDPHPSIKDAPTTPYYTDYDPADLGGGPLNPNHVIAGSGAGVIIAQFVRAVADSGDGVLVAGPCYGAFERDVGLTNDVKCVSASLSLPVPVQDSDGGGEGKGGNVKFELEENFTTKEVERMEEVLKDCESEGRKIRAVILCNPHNPLGRCYPRSTIIAYAQFCEKHNLHLLSDELYAFSHFTSADYPSIPADRRPPFVSTLAFDWRKDHGVDPARIHVIYGMSKDFHSNGFRVAVLISPFNPDLILSIRTTSPFMMTSTPADLLFSAILSNKKWREFFLAENRRRLQEAYELITGWLNWHKVGYVAAYAGQFIMVNFRPFLVESADNRPLLDKLAIPSDASMKDREKAFIMYGVRKFRVHFASGTAFQMPEGGWVRLTFSVERERCLVGFRRVERMMGWEEAPLREGDGYSKVDGVAGVPKVTGNLKDVDSVERVVAEGVGSSQTVA